MKKLLIVMFVLVSTIACQRVPAGHVGIKVYLLGGAKGVDHEELGVGRYWIGINEELHLFPTFKQNYVWTMDPAEGSKNNESITFNTRGGMEVGADVGITYTLDPTKVSLVFEAYRRGVEEITDTFLRNHVRDAFVDVASTMDVQSVYGEGKRGMVDKVQLIVTKQVEEVGIKIEKVYLIGGLRLPPTVVKALNAKIEATQKAQQRENEIRQAEAEAKKKVATAQGDADSTLTRAKSQAEANKILSRSLTKELVEYERVKKWNGALPQVTGAAGTLFNMNSVLNK